MNFKIKVRDFVSRILFLVPISLLNIVKYGQFKSGITSSIASFAIKKIIRYRKIDSNIKDFSLLPSSGLKFVNDGSSISRLLYWRGIQGYEYFETKLWKYLCSCDGIAQVIELGANIGYFTIVGASASKLKYTAVEANPSSAECLKANVTLNKLENVTVIASAVVGQKTEEFTELFIPIVENDESAPRGAYVGGGESISRASLRSVKVRTIEARNIISCADLIKLDIEGYEFIVLNSIIDEIIKLRPLIWVEVRRNTHELRNLLSMLSSENKYEIYAIGEGKLYRVSSADIKTVILQDLFNTLDVIVVPIEKTSIIDAYKE